MIIAICGSLIFHKEMRNTQRALEALGYTAYPPKSLDLIDNGTFCKPKTVQERLAAEDTYDFIREHFKKVEQSDAILVVNPTHHSIEGYIGGNTFLEMGVAFYLGKIIYLMHPIPKMGYELEIAAMRPIVLHGDCSAIKNFPVRVNLQYNR